MKNKKAFSLVELSIVLIIIGLLVAGVSSGSKLIMNAKIQKFLTKRSDIMASIGAFQVAYDALPGDFSEAQAFFTSSACPDHSASSGAHASLDCDGDGNGKVGSIYAADGALYESFYTYKHMELAEVYGGGFAPDTLSTSIDVYTVNELNTPSFNIGGATGYYAFWGNNGGIDSHKYIYGAAADSTASGNVGKPYGPAFTGLAANKVDRKLDDGVINTGFVKGISTVGPGQSCSYSNSTNTAVCRLEETLR